MRAEARRWWRQAGEDLKAAAASRQAGAYEWAAFQAQQAAEKGLKALLYERGRTSILTHSIKELMDLAEGEGVRFDGLGPAAKALDAVYIPSRYPNGLGGDLTPHDYYDLEDADRCISFAESIQEIVKGSLAP